MIANHDRAHHNAHIPGREQKRLFALASLDDAHRQIGRVLQTDGEYAAGNQRGVIHTGRIVGIDDRQAAGQQMLKQSGLGMVVIEQGS